MGAIDHDLKATKGIGTGSIFSKFDISSHRIIDADRLAEVSYGVGEIVCEDHGFNFQFQFIAELKSIRSENFDTVVLVWIM